MDFREQMAAIKAQHQKRHAAHVREREEEEAQNQRRQEILKQVIQQWTWVYHEAKKNTEQKAGEKIVRWIRRLPSYSQGFVNADDILMGKIPKGPNFIRIKSDLGWFGFDLRDIGPRVRRICPDKSEAALYVQAVSDVFPFIIRSTNGNGSGDLTWKNIEDILYQWEKVDTERRGDILMEEIRYRKAECKDIEKMRMFIY